MKRSFLIVPLVLFAALLHGGTTTLGSPGGTEPAQYYFSENLLLTNDLVIDGPVEMVVKGDLNPNGYDIRVTANGSLTLFLDANLNMHGGSQFINEGKAKNLLILGTRTSSQQDFVVTDSQQFNGAVYAPNANVMFNGGDGVYYGAVTAKNITFNANNVKFHFDEALSDLALTVHGFAEQTVGFTITGYKVVDGSGTTIEMNGQPVQVDTFIDQFFP